METVKTKEKIEQQVHFWSVLGPFIILLSLVILVFKVSSDQLHFPLAALVGVPMCLKWRVKGLACALTMLLGLLFYSYSDLPLEDRYWHVGMAIAFAVSFVILTLSVEEVQSIVNGLQTESKSRLDHLFRLDEKLKSSQQTWSQEKQELVTRLEIATQEAAAVQSEQYTYQKLASLAKEELVSFRSEYERVLQNLHSKNEQLTALNERFYETETALQNLSKVETEQQRQELIRTLTLSQEELLALKEQQDVLENTIKQISQEKEELNNEVEHLNVLLKGYEEKIGQSFTDQELAHEQYELLKAQSAETAKEIQVLNQTLASLQNEYDGLRLSERQQKMEISQLQGQLGDLKSLIETKERETIFARDQKKQAESILNQREGELRSHIDELNQKWKEAISQFEHEKEWLQRNYKQDKEFITQQLASAHKEIETYRTQLMEQTDSFERTKTQLIQIQSERDGLKLGLSRTSQEKELLNQQIQQHHAKAGEQFSVLQKDSEAYLVQLKEKANELQQLEESLQLALKEKEVLQIDLNFILREKEQFIHDLEQGNEALKHQLSESLKASDEEQSQLRVTEQLLAEKEELISKFKTEHEHFQNTFSLKDYQISEAKARIKDLEKMCTDLRTELSQIVQQQVSLDENKQTESHRIEAMYKQLKEQFHEKSMTLDATRRELFTVQENLLSLKKDWEETQQFDLSENEYLLQQDLDQLYSQLEKLEVEYKQEIQDLNEVIENLLNQLEDVKN